MAEKDEQVTWYWKDLPGVMAGISHKNAGWMNADEVDLARGATGKANRDKFFARLGFDPEKTVAITGLRHTTNVAAVDFTNAGQVIYGADGVDGLSTDQPGLILASTMADCLPIYFYDPVAKVVAIAHAGWRGVLSNMIEAMVKHLQNNYPKTQLNNLQALVGPGLRPCHFEVLSDVEELFKKRYSNYTDYREGKIYIDLPAIVKQQLSQVGLVGDNIQDTGECNYDLTDKYFSFRRDHPPKPQSMIAFVALRNE
ncbi:polyphenol oxidase family protein [Patescibacteria group bacterium]|nr:polyphenol oxidase family protein [Patescibacteria group bacterium]